MGILKFLKDTLYPSPNQLTQQFYLKQQEAYLKQRNAFVTPQQQTQSNFNNVQQDGELTEDIANYKAHDCTEDIMLKQKELNRPEISVINATDYFYTYKGSKFDFSNIPTVKYPYRPKMQYLIVQENGGIIFRDMRKLDELMEMAQNICEVPSFKFPMENIVYAPTWITYKNIDGQITFGEWTNSQICPLPFTKTGKIPKYVIKVILVDNNHQYQATIYYDQNDSVGKGTIMRRVTPDESFSLDFRDNTILRIMHNIEGEYFPLYDSCQ